MNASTKLDGAIAREADWIRARHMIIAAHHGPLKTPPTDNARAGLALSGGGIRSATFSLGLMQALSRHGCFAGIDYLSTVSGGSYTGSFFGALYIPPEQRFGDAEDDVKKFVTDPLGSPRGIKAIARLREFGRYLTPGGTSDLIFGTSLIARNWLALQLVLGLVPLFLFLLVRCVRDLTGLAILEELVPSGSANILLLAVIVWVIACGIGAGYWLSRKEEPVFSRIQRLFTPLFGLVTVATTLGWIILLPQFTIGFALLFVVISTCAVLGYVVALTLYGKPVLNDKATATEQDKKLAAFQAEDTVRARMTRWLASLNTAVATLLALMVVNLLGEMVMRAIMYAGPSWGTVVDSTQRRNLWVGIRDFIALFWPVLAVLAPLALTVWTHSALRRGTGPGWLARPSGQMVLGLSILLLWLAVWAGVAAGITQLWDAHPWLPLVLLTIAIVLQALMYGFLNLSSLVTLYAARLKRAYVGASNPGPGMGGYDIDQPGDLVPMYTYYGVNRDATAGPVADTLAHARPLHLINVTVAQTEAVGESHVVAYDRKGLPLHVGPAGIVSGTGRDDDKVQWRKFGECEPLSLSEWTAISGAAASTAMGGMSSLGLSVLTMMTNVRLGYWWKHDQVANWELPRSWRDTVPGYLFSEMTLHFDTSLTSKRRWYLSDGGHFENTGTYALLQRRLKFILVSDNGADPEYHCDDMVRLIQRARIDLNIKITFLDATGLDAQFGDECRVRRAFDRYDALASKPQADRTKGGPYAALARIDYDDGSGGWLMLVKPRLSFAEPPELLAYHARSGGREFPQQTTLDQFFDEEQWEAYRRLGELVGDALFAPVDTVMSTKPIPWLPGDYLRYQTELPV